MKKIRNTILLITAFVVFITSVILTIHFFDKSKLQQTFESASTTLNADEILTNSENVKATNIPNALHLKETSDIAFDIENKSTQKVIKSIDTAIYSSVFLKSEYFSSADNEFSNEKLTAIENIASAIKEKGLSVYLECSLSLPEDTLSKLSIVCDGFLFCDSKDFSADALEEKISKIKEILPNSVLYVSLSLNYDYSSLKANDLYSIHLTVSDTDDTEKAKLWNSFAKEKGFKLCFNISFSKTVKDETACALPLKILYNLNSLEAFSLRAFSGYSAIQKDTQGSFSAVKEYITNGINEYLAFREIAITGYNGQTESTSEFTKEIEVYGSNLFPIYMDSKQITSKGTASKKITLSLKEGENVFTFTGAGKEIQYKINFDFSGDIISTVLPTSDIVAQPGEKIKIMVVAFSKAEISVKVGTETFEAKPAEKENLCYTVFVANVTMPKTAEEIASLGMITVIGSYGDVSVQQKGAAIVAGETITTTSPITDAESTTEMQSTTRVVIENYVPDLPSEAYSTTQYSTTQATTTNNIVSPQQGTYTGSQMCIVTVPYANTWPLIDNDDTYVPYYTPLVSGTMDYVTAESEAYNSEEGEMVYFYELSSGRKVKREDVSLIERIDLPSNTLNVLSSESNNGTLKITLSSTWKIPYHFNYSPQDYYRAHSKLYNVSSFTANYIQFTFYHTGAASGSIDCSGSNVVSSATWGSTGDVITLTLPLRQAGVYYGYSLEYDANGNMVITIHNKPQSLSGTVILLDPGHGGTDPGALGLSGAVHEKNVNYAIAYYTKLALESKGATVYMTRGGDSTLSLEERKAIARSLKPDLFVAIHCNGSTNKNEIGTSTYYYKPFSQKLAQNIYNRLLTALKNSIYYGQTEYFDDISDGTMYYPFSVTRLEDCPSVLVETAFMTNDTECYALIETQNQQLFAEAIANGIEDTIVNS